MKTRWNRVGSVLLVITMLFSLFPLSAGTADSEKYGKVTGEKRVNVRKGASTSEDAWFMLEPGTVCEKTGDVETVGNQKWYPVRAEDPDHKGVYRDGMILGDFFVMLTDEEEKSWLSGQKTVSPTLDPNAAYGKINRGGGTNFRYGPSTKDNVIDKLDLNTVVEIKTAPSVISEDTWYKVEYNGYVGYIMSPFITVISGPIVTPVPVGPTATPGPSKDPVTSLVTTKGGVNIWSDINNGTQVTVVTRSGTELPCYGGPYTVANSTAKWYYVQANGKFGYIRGDCVKETNVTPAPTAAPTATTAPTATPEITEAPVNPTFSPAPADEPYGYVKTVKGGVNVWSEIGNKGERVAVASKGVTLPYYRLPQTSDNYQWYYVRINGVYGYIRSDCVKDTGATPVPTATSAPTAGPVVTDAPAEPTFTPIPEGEPYGYLKTIKGGVNVWSEIGSKGERVAVAAKGVTLPYYRAPETSGSYKWYYIQINGVYGYIRSDCVKDNAATPKPTATPKATPTPKMTEAPTATPEPSEVPTASPAPTAVPIGQVRTVKGGVNVWSDMGSNATRVTVASKGVTVPYYAGPTKSGNYTWYYIYINGVYGYIRSDTVKVVTSVVTPTPGPTAVPTASPEIRGTVTTVKTGCNFRKTPGGTTMTQIPKGVTLSLLDATPVKKDGYLWYHVSYQNMNGYLREDVVRVNGTPVVTPTPGPTAVPTASPEIKGTVTTVKTGCNFRKTPAGTTLTQIPKGVTLSLVALTPVNADGYLWYHVSYHNMLGYLREDVVHVNGAPVITPTPGPTAVPTASPEEKSSYLRTVMDKVYLRKAPGKSSEAETQVSIGTVMSYASTQKVGTSTWYQVRYNGSTLWILDECIHVMTVQEYNEYIAGQPTVTPEPIYITKGYVKSLIGGLNLRRNCVGDTTIIGRCSKGVVMPFTGDPVIVKGQSWYCVKHPQYGTAYVLGDYVTLCDENGQEITPPPVTTGPGQKEASYITLRLGSSGEEVQALVAELISQGYYKGELTGIYTSKVEEAVLAFQKAKNLTEDGIAGPDTQHALFGTVPIGHGDNELTMTIYAAEKIDWVTGGIQELWQKGATYRIYDVKTGIVWQARRWSGFNHVDAEPATAADTVRLCRIYDVKTAKEIDTKNLYQRRPCLVTIGDRTFACSLYGIPHNYPDGDTIPNNNFQGQLCIHFTNSRTSDSKKIDSGHQEAIQYAWEHAPNGHK